MSAWIVPRPHIHVLVQALINERLIDPAEASAIGTTLWKENYKSVNTRYGERKRAPQYQFHGIEAPLEDAAVLMAVRCFDYQTCEYDGYERAPGMRRLNQLSTAICTRLGIADDAVRDFAEGRAHARGFTRAGEHWWGIEDVRHAIRPDALGIQLDRLARVTGVPDDSEEEEE